MREVSPAAVSPRKVVSSIQLGFFCHMTVIFICIDADVNVTACLYSSISWYVRLVLKMNTAFGRSGRKGSL